MVEEKTLASGMESWASSTCVERGWSWMKDAKSLWYEYVGMCNVHLYENFLATSVE